MPEGHDSDVLVLRPSGFFRWFSLGFGIAGLLLGAACAPEALFVALVLWSWFGLLTAAALRQVWPGANYLRLTREGFTVRSILQHYFVPWADVKEFFVWRLCGFHGYIAFRLKEGCLLKRDRGAMSLGVGRHVPDSIDGLLPYRYGGETREETVARLERWRSKAVGPRGEA